MARRTRRKATRRKSRVGKLRTRRMRTRRMRTRRPIGKRKKSSYKRRRGRKTQSGGDGAKITNNLPHMVDVGIVESGKALREMHQMSTGKSRNINRGANTNRADVAYKFSYTDDGVAKVIDHSPAHDRSDITIKADGTVDDVALS